MNYNIITIFPDLIDAFSDTGFIKRSIKNNIININIINLREYSASKHKRVDEKTYGGGPGMVMQYQPIYDAIENIKDSGPIIYLSPQGEPLTQAKLKKLSYEENLTLLCGRYEGIDQRAVDDLVDEEISLGDYVISGGESASMVLLEGITRLIPGAVDDEESVNQDSFQAGILDYPHYTKPEKINDMKIPDVLISGNHEKIEIWRRKQALGLTWRKRPELLKNVKLSKEDDKLLKEYILENKENDQK
ncbi:MAG: tRNA (guanosine(37)-N1)-methyltransferase TrmD [Pseudomonadota bacterium]|nr:tRNA (guanosine(37)-N1)-methyltransferase TrmD [Pseudomonadota bacterium]